MRWQQGQLKAFNDCAQRLRKLKNSRWNIIKWEHGDIPGEKTRITVADERVGACRQLLPTTSGSAKIVADERKGACHQRLPTTSGSAKIGADDPQGASHQLIPADSTPLKRRNAASLEVSGKKKLAKGRLQLPASGGG